LKLSDSDLRLQYSPTTLPPHRDYLLITPLTGFVPRIWAKEAAFRY